jgi:hypothetical protein
VVFSVLLALTPDRSGSILVDPRAGSTFSCFVEILVNRAECQHPSGVMRNGSIMDLAVFRVGAARSIRNLCICGLSQGLTFYGRGWCSRYHLVARSRYVRRV